MRWYAFVAMKTSDSAWGKPSWELASLDVKRHQATTSNHAKHGHPNITGSDQRDSLTMTMFSEATGLREFVGGRLKAPTAVLEAGCRSLGSAVPVSRIMHTPMGPEISPMFSTLQGSSRRNHSLKVAAALSRVFDFVRNVRDCKRTPMSMTSRTGYAKDYYIFAIDICDWPLKQIRRSRS